MIISVCELIVIILYKFFVDLVDLLNQYGVLTCIVHHLTDVMVLVIPVHQVE